MTDKKLPSRLLALLGMYFVAGVSQAQQWGHFERDFDQETKPWVEFQASLPVPPDARELVRIDLGNVSAHRHFVDRASITAESDGVVRYTIVVESAGGARNVSYEGMRCQTGEWKLYAFGRPDGSWTRNKYARWDSIKARQSDSYRRELFFHYFCTVDGAADMTVIRRALAAGGIRRGGGDLF